MVLYLRNQNPAYILFCLELLLLHILSVSLIHIVKCGGHSLFIWHIFTLLECHALYLPIPWMDFGSSQMMSYYELSCYEWTLVPSGGQMTSFLFNIKLGVSFLGHFIVLIDPSKLSSKVIEPIYASIGNPVVLHHWQPSRLFRF